MNNISSTVNILFGISDGSILHISEVPKGLACNCTCSKCGKVLKARKGSKNVWHFSHHVDSICPGGGVSDIHRYAQELVIKSKYIYVHKIGQNGLDRINFQKVEQEVSIDMYRCDNVGITNNSNKYYIEFHYKNPCEQEKLTYYISNSLRSIEIHLDKILELENPEHIKDYILKDSRREWIYHPTISNKFLTDEDIKEFEELGLYLIQSFCKWIKKMYIKWRI